MVVLNDSVDSKTNKMKFYYLQKPMVLTKSQLLFVTK